MKVFPPLAASLCLAPLLALAAPPTPQFRTEGALRQFETQQQRPSASASPQFRTGNLPAGAAPELYPGEAEDIGPQLLLSGAEQQQIKRKWFEVAVDSQFLYTSNMFLTEKGNTDTNIWINTVQFAIAPDPFEFAGGQLAPRVGYRHQRWLYGLDSTANQYNNFDFDVGSVFLGANYTFHENWVATLGLDYNRLLSIEQDLKEFYTELLVSWALERRVTLGENHLLQFTYTGGDHFTHADPSPFTKSNDRFDSVLGVTWTWSFREKWLVQPYYRFQHSHYWDNDRDDLYHTVGATLGYTFNDWASARLFVSWEKRESDDRHIPDYHKLDAGGGVTVMLRF